MSFCVVCVLIFNNDNDPFGALFNVVIACAFHGNGMVMFKLQHHQWAVEDAAMFQCCCCFFCLVACA